MLIYNQSLVFNATAKISTPVGVILVELYHLIHGFICIFKRIFVYIFLHIYLYLVES